MKSLSQAGLDVPLPSGESPLVIEKLKSLAAEVGWRAPGKTIWAARRPVVLLYHGIPRRSEGDALDAESFERHLVFLKANFTFLHPADVAGSRRGFRRDRVLLTFDDGFRNNAERAAPLLQKHGIPALFFISTRHCEERRYLWWSYLKMLKNRFRFNGFLFRGKFMDMSAVCRLSTVADLTAFLTGLRPHPAAMYEVIERELPPIEDFVSADELVDHCAGMTPDQIETLSQNPLFLIGAHTLDHPLLTQCEEAEALRQVSDNKRYLEKLTRQACDLIAYPMADFDARTLAMCRSLGIRQGYSVAREIHYDAALEQKRVGIYSRSLTRLGAKVRWGNIFHG